MNDTPPEQGELTATARYSLDTIGIPSSAREAGPNTITPQRIGDFTIIRVLGEGGMGTVYLAEDVRLGRKAAIKTMKPALAAKLENRLRFVREARAAAAVEHDNIVPIWHVGDGADGSPFIAMPFLQGETLESRLKREPIQPLGIILKVACEVAEGLAAAHARGLIHRDIKPGNVWIEGDPDAKNLAGQVRRCKILDFGLARSLEIEDVQVTASGTILGTPAYMAPEQASGEKMDHRADLFSLGVMLYRMSTGRLPFAGPNTMAVLTALATTTPPPARTRNRNLPQALSDLIDRLLCKNPASRPQSAAAVRQIAQEQQGKSTPVGMDPVPQDQPTQVGPASVEELLEDTVPVEPKPAPKATVKPKRGRTLLLVALGLLALVPLGWWLATVLLRVETPNGTLVVQINDPEVEARIKNGKLILTGPDDKVRYTLVPSERNKEIEAGPYKIRVEGADGLILDMSEFTLKKGGKITVRVTVEPKGVVKNLDPDRKAAEWVLSIGGTVRVNGEDRDIQAADLPPGAFRLTGIKLSENKQVSDAGLIHFKDCKNLKSLDLSGTKVSDKGLVHFKDCKNLTDLGLGGTQVSDAGLIHFKDCKNLMSLNLWSTQVSDAGLILFKDCKSLGVLSLAGTKVSDKGMAFFKDCKGLGVLSLAGTQVSDSGMVHFKDCKNLTSLNLGGTKVGDAGMVHFKDCKNLTSLNLWSMQVSDAGLAFFKDCKSLEVLSLAGTKVSDAGMACFKDCKTLTGLDLWGTKVSDAGLIHFKDRKNLTSLILAGTQVSDLGLAYFKDCKNLTVLELSGTKVSNAGLAHFKDCKNLTDLNLWDTQVSDSDLAQFKDWKTLMVLRLGGTQVSDAGLVHLKDCKNLTHLSLQQTKVTRAKIEELKKALPKCKIEWDER